MTTNWSSVTPDRIAGSDKSALIIGPFGSSLKTSDFAREGVPLIFVRDIRVGDFSRPRAYVNDAKAKELQSHVAAPGDILVTKMGDPPGDACIYDGTVPAIITADCIRLRPSPEFDARYVMYAIRSASVRNQIIAITSGAAQKKVSLSRFRHGLEIPVPPLSEQRRVAAVLDHADTVRSLRLRSIAGLDRLGASFFQETVRENPCTERVLGEMADVQGGLQVSNKRAGLPLSAPYLRVANVHRNRLDLSEIKTILLTAIELRRTILERDDLLLVEGRANPQEIGRVAVWDGSVEGCTHQNHLIRVRTDRAVLDPIFATYWLNSLAGAAHLRRAARTTSGLNTLSTSDVRLAPMLVPKMEVQKAFAAKIRAIEMQRREFSLSATYAVELCASIEARAFRGEL